MIVSTTTPRRLRAAGTATAWLGGWAVAFTLATLVGTGGTLAGLQAVMIVFSGVLVAVSVVCRLAARAAASGGVSPGAVPADRDAETPRPGVVA
jgi:hypothetical protein